jgi:hypothetical protein
MHANNVFSFLKNHFWHQHIKTIQNVQIILNFSKKKNLNFLKTQPQPRSQTFPEESDRKKYKNHSRKGRVITICWVNASQRLAQILREHPTAKELVCVCERAHSTITPPKSPPLGKSGPSAKYLLRHAC